MKYLKVLWKAEKSIYLYWLVWAIFVYVVNSKREQFDTFVEFLAVTSFLGIVGIAIYTYSVIIYSDNKDV
jgi:hypothetical protein